MGCEPDHSVRFEPARSAEPPISSGNTRRQRLDDILRGLARGDAVGSCRDAGGRSPRTSLRSPPAGPRACASANSRACAGNARRVPPEQSHSSRASASRAGLARIPGLIDRRREFKRGMRSIRIARAWRRSPSSPSGAPCDSCVPALVGAPLPMTVLQQMSVGRVGRALAATNGAIDRLAVVAVHVRHHMPAVGLEALAACRR